MHFRDNIALSFQGTEWIATHRESEFSSDSLEGLDREVENYFKSILSPSGGDTLTVHYLFDNNSIPEWIRQYSNHYFNRKVEFKF